MIKRNIKLIIEGIWIRKNKDYDGISWWMKREKHNILDNYWKKLWSCMEEIYLRKAHKEVIISIVDLSIRAIEVHIYNLICCV
jgi:hypothetical protein